MSESTKEPAKPVVDNTPATNEEKVAYLQSLKEQASLLGISYSGNISAESLSEKINGHLKELAEKKKANEAEAAEKAKGEVIAAQAVSGMGNEDLAMSERRRNAKLLHRVIVSCHNPSKAKHSGQIFTVGNTKFGSETKLVQFNQPWHVSTMMLNALKEKVYLAHYAVKDQRTGHTVTKHRQVPEFSIQVLPPLTNDELRVLAEKQKLRDSGEAAK